MDAFPLHAGEHVVFPDSVVNGFRTGGRFWQLSCPSVWSRSPGLFDRGASGSLWVEEREEERRPGKEYLFKFFLMLGFHISFTSLWVSFLFLYIGPGSGGLRDSMDVVSAIFIRIDWGCSKI